MNKVITKGERFCDDCSGHSVFLTILYDNQTNININIYEGEKIIAKDNHFLAKISINIPPMPSWKPQIEVKFLYEDDYMTFIVVEHLSRIKAEIKTNNSLSIDCFCSCRGCRKVEPEKLQKYINIENNNNFIGETINHNI